MKVYPLEAHLVDLGNLCRASMIVSDVRRDVVNKAVADISDPDLVRFTGILCHTGWNLNDDVFVRDELVKSITTPVDKPVSLEHDSANLVGHIVSASLCGDDGVPVGIGPSGYSDSPTDVRIDIGGVLYPLAQATEQQDVIWRIAAGQMALSMECFFDDIAYAIRDETTGVFSVLARTPATSFLTKHLRIYGGSGLWGQRRLGRVLLNLTFAGGAVVSDPADPRAVIMSIGSFNGGSTMDESTAVAAEVQRLTDEVSALTTKCGELTSSLEASAQACAEAKSALEAKSAECQKLQTDCDAAAASVVAITGERDALTTERDALAIKVTECEAMASELAILKAAATEAKLDQTAKDRFDKMLVVRPVADDKVAETMAELRGMTDETFAVVLRYAGSASANVTVPELTADSVVLPPEGDVSLGTVTIDDQTKETARAVAQALLPRPSKENKN